MENETRIPQRAAVLVDAALAGGRAVMAVYATEFKIDVKSDATPVSQVTAVAYT